MQTIPDFFEENVNTYPDNVFMLEKTGDNYAGTTYKQTLELVRQFAAGLISLGVKKGDRLALLSEGRNSWIVSELGMLYLGAINVPLSVKLTESDEIRFRLAHSGSGFIVASASQAPKIRAIRDKLPNYRKMILLNSESTAPDEITYDEVLASGQALLSTEPGVLDKVHKSVSPDDTANICYTSGTTADPKGIMLTHRNYIANVKQAYSLMDIPPHFTTLLILPWDHAFAHTAGIYCMMGKGASLASVQIGKTGIETLKNIPLNIREIRPHLLMSVPSLADNFKKNIHKNIRDKGALIYILFKHSLRIAYAYNNDGYTKGKGLTFLYKPLIKLYDKILFSKIREGFGGRLEFFIGGGALLDIEYQKFFYAIGMPMFQGYGLSEASPVISSNAKLKHKLGSSGFLVNNMELKICDNLGNELPLGKPGEIVIRGENVMAGYWDNPEATQQTIRNGWLYTGDLGYMDADGFLYVLGRNKSLLISDDGEKYSPEGIEEALLGHGHNISQCMLYNNQKAYTIGLIVPDVPALKRHLHHKGVKENTDEYVREALKLVDGDVQQFRTGGKLHNVFPQRWLPSVIGILGDGFTEGNHMMNSTMKMVRGKITSNYQPLIDYLYSANGKDLYNSENMKTMRELLNK